jgi:hypothetical protein
MNKKTIEELEKELEDLKTSHRSQWDTYGSELCAGDMIRQEEELEKKIREAKTKATGIEQLRKVKEETINRWEKSGLLTGLVGNPNVNMAKMFESNPNQKIEE